MGELNQFGKRLEALRKKKANELGRRITQAEIAEELKITPAAYSAWETGRTRPTIEALPQLARIFSISIDDLLGYELGNASSLNSKTEFNLSWSLRRPSLEEPSWKGVEAWRLLVQGKDIETIKSELGAHSQKEVEQYLLGVIYSDTINIDHLARNNEMATQLQQKFGLKKVEVISMHPKWLLRFKYIILGEAARLYFKSQVNIGWRVGISGGYAVSRLVYALRPGDCESIHVYPLATSPIEDAAIEANSLVGALSYRHFGHNVRGYKLPFTSLSNKVGSEISRFQQLSTQILSLAKSVDIAFIGLGDFEHKVVPGNWPEQIAEKFGVDLELLRNAAVGDILYHPVNQDGQPVPSEIDNLFRSLELEDLRRMVEWGEQQGQQVVAIAAGNQKMRIAYACLKGKYANVFIIDDELAGALLTG